MKMTCCRDVINVRLQNHGAHRLLNRSVLKLIIGVFLPDFLQVEKGPSYVILDEL